jgi:5'-3' exonuclease
MSFISPRLSRYGETTRDMSYAQGVADGRHLCVRRTCCESCRDDFSPLLSCGRFSTWERRPISRITQYKTVAKPIVKRDAGDLAQQIPYIRRASKPIASPWLEAPGYELTDVIGDAGKRKRRISAGRVYVVSTTRTCCKLCERPRAGAEPAKGYLICDAAKVQEILGLPPIGSIDVMALRGDSIDTHTGAPGIGTKVRLN